MRSAAKLFRSAFPDWQSTVEDLIAVDDMVVERFTARGTHQADLMHIAATGRAVTLGGINIFRLRDGRTLGSYGQFLRTSGRARPADLQVAPESVEAQSVAHALCVGSFCV
jgi:predicted ester cyclase